MWYKVNELKEKHYKKSQISRELSIDRKTVSRYLSMSKEVFLSSSIFERRVNPKLLCYKTDILDLLEECTEFSSSQIHDRLREKHSDFPCIHRNTVNNYVQRLRNDYNLPKTVESFRQYSHLPESEYGEYAQVDFGEKWVYTQERHRSIKLYFMAMVLSRSRYKFIYFQRTPFTSKTANYAHELAFEHIGGIPKKIIYDQDKVFIYRENLGDYLLTKDFSLFCSKYHFKPIFCKKNDPESKGKVENVVKYVKGNFLRGRRFTDIEELNNQALLWMDRTGNGLVHGTTKLVPKEELKQEKPFFLPYVGTPILEEEVMLSYKIRKDNTVNYRGNFYTVPLGTYQGSNTEAYITINNLELIIYSKETGKTIATHNLSTAKGKLISRPEHTKRDQTKVTELEQSILSVFNNEEVVKLYLNSLSENKPRYYKDNLRYLQGYLDHIDKSKTISVMIQHINNNIFNAEYLISSINEQVKRNSNSSNVQKYTHMIPEVREVSSYNQYLP